MEITECVFYETENTIDDMKTITFGFRNNCLDYEIKRIMGILLFNDIEFCDKETIIGVKEDEILKRKYTEPEQFFNVWKTFIMTKNNIIELVGDKVNLNKYVKEYMKIT